MAELNFGLLNQQAPDQTFNFARGVAQSGQIQGQAIQNRNLAQQGQLQQQAGQMKLEEGQREAYMQKANIFGEAMSSISSLPEAQRPQAYGQIRQELLQNGIIDESKAPQAYDPQYVGMMTARYQQTKDALAKQQTRAQIAALGQKAAQENQSVFAKESEKKSAQNFAKIQDAAGKADERISRLDDTLNTLVDFQKSSLLGTGPVATLGGMSAYLSSDTELLDRKFKDLALRDMQDQFAGMSKAIDSDAERRFFTQTKGAITNRPETNANILLGAKSVALKAKAEAEAQQEFVNRYGTLNGYKSPIIGRLTAVVDKTGQMQLIPKEQMKVAKAQGFMDVDAYSKSLFSGKGKSMPGSAYAAPGAGMPDFNSMSEAEISKYLEGK